MLQRERLGNESAHRPSQYACAFEAKRLDHMRGVTGELGDVECLSIIGRAPDPAVIDKDQFVRRRKAIDK
jgi:hypothetical protein